MLAAKLKCYKSYNNNTNGCFVLKYYIFLTNVKTEADKIDSIWHDVIKG